MNRVFEDYFAELQEDMLDICLEFVDYEADKVYVYCSREGRMLQCDYFYRLDGEIIERWNVIKLGLRESATSENEDQVLDILMKDATKLEKVCNEYSRPMPTEIKMIYDVKKHTLDTKYKYENQWLNTKDRVPHLILEEWITEEKKLNNK